MCLCKSATKWFRPGHLYWVLTYPNASILVPNPTNAPQSQLFSSWPLSRNPPDVCIMWQKASVWLHQGALGPFPLRSGTLLHV